MWETGPEPSTAPAKSDKPKRLTLQERLALAAKSKKIPSNTSSADTSVANSHTGAIELNPNSFSQDSLLLDKDLGEEDIKLLIEASNRSVQAIELAIEESDDEFKQKVEESLLLEGENLSKRSDSVSEHRSSSVIDTDKETGNTVNEEPDDDKTNSNTPITCQVGSFINPALSSPLLPKSDPRALVQPPSDRDSSLEGPSHPSDNDTKELEIENLKKQINLLHKSLDSKNEELTHYKTTAASSNLEKKLREKEAIIAQLIKEGTELSGKELKLNERIRTLVAQNKKLESSLLSYAEKHEQNLLKIREIEDTIKFHKYNSIEQLLDSMAKSHQRLSELESTIDRERKNNWEGKYKELQKLYESSIDEQRAVRKEISEKLVKLELLENQTKLELTSKEEIISRLNQDVINFKDEASVELLRLELKVEQLRLENESFLRRNHSDASALEDAANSKQIGYQDYAKLSKVNQHLQEQLLGAQETWRVIEVDLQLKIESLNETIDSLKRSKSKTSDELKKVYAKANEQAERITAFRNELSRANEAEVETAFKLKMKTSECAELEEKLSNLRSTIDVEKTNYELKLQTLTETITALQNQAPEFPASIVSENIQIQDLKMPLYQFQGFRMKSTTPLLLQYLSHIGFPLCPNLAISTPMNFGDDHFQLPETFSSYVNSEIYPQDAADSGSSSTPVCSAAGATKNIQLLSKMSSSIRRLEMDVVTLKEENEELVKEKEQAQLQIVVLLDVQKTVLQLEAQAANLTELLAEKNKQEETLLQVIGEKLERVEELQADVEDLKDLMRQQVQQMIEMRLN